MVVIATLLEFGVCLPSSTRAEKCVVAIARPGQLPEVAFCEATRSGKLPALPRKRIRDKLSSS